MPSYSKTASFENDVFSSDTSDLDYEVVKIIYSKDKETCFKILRRHNGVYTYKFEKFYYYDEDELKYRAGDGVGFWCPIGSSASFFASAEEAVTGAKSEAIYKTYFI